MFAASTALKIHGDHPAENLFQLGLGRFLHGDYQQAAAHFTAALKHDPANSIFYCRRGEVFRLLCDYERAIADFTSALRLEPPNTTEIFVKRAVAYLRYGDPHNAVADASAALNLNADNAAALRIRAVSHAELGSLDRAIADLTRCLELTPKDDEVFYERGLILAKKEDYGHAIADFDLAIALNPFRVSAFFERANAHFCLKDYLQAIRDYSEVLRHQPNHVLAYGNRALCHKRRGERDRAIADYTEALRLDVTGAQNYYQRGLLYRANGDLLRAEADLDEAIRLQPENWAAGYHRAKVFLAQDRITLALEDLEWVLRLNPKLVVGYLSRALAKDRIGRYRDATADSTHALKLDESLAVCHLVRGLIRIHKEEYVAAVADLSEAIERDERIPPTYFLRGLAHALHGDSEAALLDCNRFIALEPANSQAYVLRSIVYHSKGQVEEALADYARVLEIDPRLFLTGLNHGLADVDRALTTRQLADYIDGILPKVGITETPAGIDFRIILQPKNATPAEQPIEEFEIEEILDDSATTTSGVDKTQFQETCGTGTETSPLSSVHKGKEPGGKGSLHTMTATHLSKSIGERVISPNACPLCSHVGPPSETLEGGRVRCAKCAALFVATSPEGLRPFVRQFAPPRKPAKPATKKLSEDQEEESLFKKWKKPLPLTIVSVLVLAAVFLFFPKNLLGKTNRLSVVPAQGVVNFQGKATPGAVVFFHPIGVKDLNYPTPRGTVMADGTFVLGTYTESDGAPVGEYKATVQWFAKVENPEKDDGVMPRNQLPVKYARAETSGLSVRIQEGENKIPAFQLMR